MKISIPTLAIMAIATSLSFGQEAPKKEGKQPPDPEKIFKKLDSNSDGSVSLDEFKASPRGQKNPEKAGEIFKKLDTDSSGGISLEEFKAHPPKPPHKKKPKGEGQ